MRRRAKREERQIDLFMLSCLVSLVREQSVSRAARKMGVTQPAMSQVIGRLREITGDPLFVRGAHGVLPTARALQLSQSAQKAVDLIEGAFWTAPKFRPSEEACLFSIMASDYVQMVFFPQMLSKLIALSPKSSLRGVLPELRRMPQDLEAGIVDIAIGLFPTLPPSLRSVGLFHDRLVCVLPKEGFVHRRTISMQEYLALNHVVFFAEENGSSTMERHTANALSLLGGERRIALHAQNMSTMMNAVVQHGFVATLPSRMVQQATNAGLKTFAPPFPIPEIVMSMVWHERRHHEPAHHWLRSIAREAAKKLRS